MDPTTILDEVKRLPKKKRRKALKNLQMPEDYFDKNDPWELYINKPSRCKISNKQFLKRLKNPSKIKEPIQFEFKDGKLVTDNLTDEQKHILEVINKTGFNIKDYRRGNNADSGGRSRFKRGDSGH